MVDAMACTIMHIHPFRRRFQKNLFFGVKLDDGRELVVHEETLVTCHLRIGMEVDDEVSDRITFLEQRMGALEKAMRLIGLRPHSKAELSAKLVKSQIPAAIAADVLEKLTASGLLNDEDFAWRYARAILKRKRIGERQLRQRLALKGITTDQIDAIVRELYPEEAQLKSALELARKKKRAYRTADEKEMRRKITAYLIQRGFSSDITRKVVKQLAGDDRKEIED